MRALRISLEGFRALASHKLRTFFMMAGTIVGIAALVAIMAAGKGTHQVVMQRVNNFGPKAMMILSGGGKDLPPPDLTVTTLTLEDAEAVRRDIDNLEIVTPIAWNFRMSLRREDKQSQAVVWGVEPSWHASYNWYAVQGEEISDEDVATVSRVCLLGQTVKRDLFGDEDPVGGRIYVNNVALTVKGVLQKQGASPGGGDFDNRIIIPITTAMRRVMNVDYLGGIRVITKDPSYMKEQIRAIKELLHQRHHIVPPQENDFRVVSPIAIAELAGGISRTLSILLISLAVLSLIVGGVVLMNILLISVGERTREIGLRRAMGATQRDIFRQFITESLAVTLLGMILGSLLGWAVSLILALTTRIPVIISWEPFVVSMLFALLAGTFFGVQPARRAARLSPVDALR